MVTIHNSFNLGIDPYHDLDPQKTLMPKIKKYFKVTDEFHSKFTEPAFYDNLFNFGINPDQG